ncbi:hypothetical protein A0H76_479 [Hepatospora eriocheir]|uniref:Uncharacterized protein n=1 Tax=Hepatospora eriocheir TaxID=1081669 RepID=A0A1X0QIP1_9MICR|nr:hypothetical protein A0H76_479 [Hepatospora eriocheir]
MEIITKVIREVLNNFCIMFYIELRSIKYTVNNISNIFIKDQKNESFNIVYFLIFVIIVLFIIIGLFASNYYIRGIGISITGGFLIYELLSTTFYLILFNSMANDSDKEKVGYFLINSEKCKLIDILKDEKDFGFSIFGFIIDILDEKLNVSILKHCLFCVEFLIYIFIYSFSNRLISIDKSLVFLVLTIMSLKTCVKADYINIPNILEKNDISFEITEYNIFYLITYAIIFILSLFVKFIRDILVNVILSVFYSIILSLLISFIYYERNDFFDRLELILSYEDVINNENFQIEFIFMGCFIIYLITIFFTWGLFWKKKTIVKMDY